MSSQKTESSKEEGLGGEVQGRSPGVITGEETSELIVTKFYLVSNQRKCPLYA